MQQNLFSCLGTKDSETVVYIAELSYTVIPGVVDVPSLLTSWVDSGPTITVNFIQLQVDTTCPVVIDSLEPQSCSTTPATSPTEVTVIAVVTCVILLLVVVTIVAAIVVAVAVFRRKQSKYKYVSAPHHHSIHTTVRCWINIVLFYIVYRCTVKFILCMYCTWCTVVVHSSVLCSPLAVQAQPSPPQPSVRE